MTDFVQDPDLGSASLQACHLSVRRMQKNVLDNIDIRIQAGEVVGLLGANGAGKSTLLNVLSGDQSDLILDSASELILNHRPLTDYNARELSRRRAVLPQSSSLNFDLSVYDVVEMGLYPFPELSTTESIALLSAALESAQVDALRHRPYQHLSGGERQRVQFARVLAQLMAMTKNKEEPAYFLLDEPTASFDPKYQRQLLKTLEQLATTQSVGILVILHDVNLASLYCSHLALLAQGEILAYGTPAEVLNTENLQAVYDVYGQVITHPLYQDKLLVVWGA